MANYVYEVKYNTFSKGHDKNREVGNICQFSATVYVEAKDMAEVEDILKEYYSEAHKGIYYVPVITSVVATKARAVLQKLKYEF